MILIGGEKAWRVRQHKWLGMSYQWLDGEPALFLYPLTKLRGTRPGAFVLPLASAWKYVNSNGHPNVQYIVEQAGKAADVMQIVLSPMTLRVIIDAIADGLPELLAMPPEPPWAAPQQEPVGELSVKVDGQTVLEQEV